VESDSTSYPLDHLTLLKYLYESVKYWGAVVKRVTVEGNRVTLEFDSPDAAAKYAESLVVLGVTLERGEVRLEYDEKFRDYLIKDRDLDEKTAKDYMNYLKKLAGRPINEDLYHEISGNSWKVKLVRIYIDYLYKNGRISFEEKERLKSIFKLKNHGALVTEYAVDANDLVAKVLKMRNGLYKLILELLLYSGARLREVIKMLKEWDERRLECFNDICRYKLAWIRGKKRCEYLFFPSKLLQMIRKYAHQVGSYSTVRKEIYEDLAIKAKDFRKLHYRLCREVLDKEICAFYQSRVSSLDVSDRHYDDLIGRATQNYPLLVESIDKLVKNVEAALK